VSALVMRNPANFRKIVATAFLAAFCALTTEAPAQTFNVIYAFRGGNDGAFPYAGVTMDGAGRLYGTTYAGGAYTTCGHGEGCGVVYQLVYRGSGWSINPLHQFGETNDGAQPEARVVFGPDGTLYGTTSSGGNYIQTCGLFGEDGYCGTVFNLRPPPSVCKTALCPWLETVIYRFNGTDGNQPASADLTFDHAGNAYGTTSASGVPACLDAGCGNVFELSPSGGGWNESVLYQFTAEFETGNYGPTNRVIFDNAGNLYGTVVGGVFELTPGEGGWLENLIYPFGEFSNGGNAGLITDQSGNFYGVSANGGEYGAGTAFELSPSGSGWTPTILYNFGQGTSGSTPLSTLVMDAAGNLYGTTQLGGQFGFGTAFKLTRSQGSWLYTSLHDFTSGSDGGNPYGQLILDDAGNVFGTTEAGGNACRQGPGCGVVFEITP
jgi:hypothetical protein